MAVHSLGHSSQAKPEFSVGKHESPGGSKPSPSPLNAGDSCLTPAETAFTRKTDPLQYNLTFDSNDSHAHFYQAEQSDFQQAQQRGQ